MQSLQKNVSPIDEETFDSICDTLFYLNEIQESVHEISYSVRTMYANRQLNSRAFVWNGFNHSDLGSLILDGTFNVEFKGLRYSLFLYETALLCCLELDSGEDVMGLDFPERYPVQPWMIGPALQKLGPLNLLFAVSVVNLQSLSCGPSGMS